MKERIVIIGGVALGPKAASRYARLCPENEVILFEQGQYISYSSCGIPYYISGDVDYFDSLRSTAAHVVRDEDFFAKMRNIDVRTSHKVTKINRQNKTVTVKNLQLQKVEELTYDKLVIATGSQPLIPKIEGIDLKGVTTVSSLESAQSIYEACSTQKISKVVILGAGFTGIEMAIALADMWSLPVTLVQKESEILEGLLSPNFAQMLKHDLEKLDIRFLLGEKVKELKGLDGNVTQVITDNHTLDADFVLLAQGISPQSTLASEAGLECTSYGAIIVDEYMRTSDENIYAGGDVVAVKNLITNTYTYLPQGSLATRQGRVIGTNLASESGCQIPFKGVVGNWCMKLHELNAAGVGFTQAAAQKAGFCDAISVGIEQFDKALFYPEKDMMSLEVTVDKKTRRLLGIQGMSENGDALKARIDAVAAMLQFGNTITIDDLSNLEVSYSPAFGSSMDAVNTAANVADNVLSNRHNGITPQEFINLFNERETNNYIFIDTRPKNADLSLAEKYPHYYFAIPLENLEECVQQLPKEKHIALICNSGLRAYEAQLLLQKHKRDSVNTMGGWQALKKRGDEL